MAVVSKIFYSLKKGKVTPKRGSRSTAASSLQGMGMQSPGGGTLPGFGGCALLPDPTCTPDPSAAETGSSPWVSDADLVPSPVNPLGRSSPATSPSRRHQPAPRYRPNALLRVCFGNNSAALCSQLECTA